MGTAADSIVDFVQAQDRVDLALIDADAVTAGDQAFSFIGRSAFSGAVGQLRAETTASGLWLQADLDGDATADFEVLLVGVSSVGVSDLIL